MDEEINISLAEIIYNVLLCGRGGRGGRGGGRCGGGGGGSGGSGGIGGRGLGRLLASLFPLKIWSTVLTAFVFLIIPINTKLVQLCCISKFYYLFSQLGCINKIFL